MAYSVPPSNEAKEVFLQGLTTLSSTQIESDLGREIEFTKGQRFKYCFTSTTFTPAPVATYPAFFFENLLQNGATVTTTHDGDLGRSFAGVLTVLQLTGGNYCWVQTAGIVPSGLVSSSVAAIGDTLTCLEAGQVARFPIQAVSTAIGGATYDLMIAPILGTAMQAASSGKADYVLHGRGK